MGDFTLSDAGFRFANGTQSLLTETTDWVGAYNDSNSLVVASLGCNQPEILQALEPTA
jgi:hypothetical protein